MPKRAMLKVPEAPRQTALPPLEMGDRLSRDEFERRYDAMPSLKKAELIEGIVYMPSPVRFAHHGEPHGHLSLWLGAYASQTPGVRFASDTTVRLDQDNEVQPDLALVKIPPREVRARISRDDYIEGPPELAVEIVGSSRAYDLNQKKDVYRRSGVLEYLTWVTGENRIVWWELRDGQYQEIPAVTGGLLKSRVFPGLWLDGAALLKGDLKAVLAILRRGLASAEHRKFATI